jgi:transcriptional regulator with XRE-family HTH domain
MRELRRGLDLTAEAFAKRSGLTRLDVTRLETAALRKPDLSKVMACLEAGGVKQGSPKWHALVNMARDGGLKGWWDKAEFEGMSARQKRCADVESGAVTIRHYHNSLIPWMLQTPDYVAARNGAWRDSGEAVDPIQGTGRLRRQAEVTGRDGPKISIVIEEQVIRRPLVDAPVLAGQLLHLSEAAAQNPRIELRLLPVSAEFGRHSTPLMPFDLFTYADPGDGIAMMTPTINDDVLVTEPVDVEPYVRLWSRLHDAALTAADTSALIAREAARVAAKS